LSERIAELNRGKHMRTRSGPRWYKSRKGYFTVIDGVQHCLGKFAEDNATNRALAWAEYNRLEAEAASQVAGDREPVSHLLAKWLAHVEKTQRKKSLKTRLFALKPFVAMSGTVAVCDLQPRHVTEFLATKTTWGKSTARIMIAAITAALSWGVEQGYITRNPLAKMKRPSAGARDVSCVVKEEEYKLMLSQASPPVADLVSTLWATGSRPGALLLATASDLHGDQLVIVDREGIKLKKIVLYLDTETQALCRRLAEKNPKGTLFRNERGDPWLGRAFEVAMMKLARRCGCPHVTPYSFRHAFAFRALARGVPVAALARLMNTSVAQIEKHYGHLDTQTDTLRKALAMMLG
jgi:integrase